MNWLGYHYIEILDPWSGNSLDLNPREPVVSPVKASGREVHKL